ncbi:hypothetical protein ACOSQ4_003033 [Xanthoceras sorbifolium]
MKKNWKPIPHFVPRSANTGSRCKVYGRYSVALKILMKEVAQGKKKLEHPYLNETVVQTTFIPEQKKSISVISSKI